ncbi:hypothetical protein [Nonomuraea turkmeniaca]|uniref:hypothetical protein n=1 Tax=Nonomuraea turkmeniaca TaxID=103838 RepID=UPI0014771278|nr:hypothetical protein [Nonomuraea turkmeniaca]
MEERNGCGAGCLVILIFLTMPLVLLVGVLMTVITVDSAQLEFRAARMEGTMGHFTAGELDCSGRGPCTWNGVYVSADGSVTKPDAWIYGYGPGELAEGERVAALDAGHDVKVFRPGHYDLVGLLLWAGFSLATLLLPVYLLRRILWKSRPKWTPARPAGKVPRL